jgi:hypothetical protein
MLPAKPTLSQVQIIQSLAEALSWFEKEVRWGVSPGELGHLTGRIGELYVAMTTRGQMALDTNQLGYDVVSALNERISVKTITSSNHVRFKLSTFDRVDRVVILRINVSDEDGVSIEELLDEPAENARKLMRQREHDLYWPVPTDTQREQRPVEDLAITARATWRDIELVRFENGAIRIRRDDVIQNVVVKDILRELAPVLGVDILNAAGEPKNTRLLGADVIRAINQRNGIG